MQFYGAGGRYANRSGGLVVDPVVVRQMEFVAAAAGAAERIGAVEARAGEQRAQLADDGADRGGPRGRGLGRPEGVGQSGAGDGRRALAGEEGEGGTALLSREGRRAGPPGAA
ncbi:MAG: hypothetical protein ACOC9N_02850 [Gemmatimonadota bacterium]